MYTGINVPKSIDVFGKLADEVNKKSEDKDQGGINIDEVREYLKNEDQYDKQLYRQRVKRMHKEKKLKEKELRRAKRSKVSISEFLKLI